MSTCFFYVEPSIWPLIRSLLLNIYIQIVFVHTNLLCNNMNSQEKTITATLFKKDWALEISSASLCETLTTSIRLGNTACPPPDTRRQKNLLGSVPSQKERILQGWGMDTEPPRIPPLLVWGSGNRRRLVLSVHVYVHNTGSSCICEELFLVHISTHIQIYLIQ